ncbi:hypothetical protein HH310_42170 [Actinoplanes sp. TBRC 11911]|uniref:hypothetical protein n=1 Tax=Actinoplanes sp. TBRC 11911 TaxID=2729386 RepID=UPI00145C713A|nr:hypothetical protein [Actinoplanes sp. TBRC 11911]NMO57757.1 hypothetical protein [Actinoplanes sp. TBRC 11911]
MVDESIADDDGSLFGSGDDGEPPFDIHDLVALDPDFLDEDDPDADLEGYVVELRPAERGWNVRVEWAEGGGEWLPSTRLVLA